MAKQTSTGILLGCVLGAPATENETGYDALTYVNLGELTNIPDFGATVQVVESNPLATGITEKFPGFVNFGSVGLEADLDDEDPGQGLATDAVAPDHASFGKIFSFELTYASGAKRYWQARFFSATEAPGSANSMVTTKMNVEIVSKIVKVAAP
ncbi:hypothetical protein NVP1151O_15 [Vibrio phage 1.151.O._10N.222.46.B1]|nr:hypothetical protein NVP1151O_15 [Vibrio phage 1.151.O._10N.222.46.B1]